MPHHSIADALNLHPGDALACVGAGGKTTTCWRIFNELLWQRQSAIWTTTTHVLEPVLPPGTALMLSKQPDPDHVRLLLKETLGVILAQSRDQQRYEPFEPNAVAPARPFKLSGFRVDQIDRLIDDLGPVTWLIEADGARGRLLKAPAEYEPAIPARANIVAVLASLQAIGRPLDDTTGHRPERIAELLNVRLGETLHAEHVARLVAHPAGGLKGIPNGARPIAVLNQHDTSVLHPQSQIVAEMILSSGRFERAVTVSLRAGQPVLAVWKR